jgi:hypothetical protein
VKRTSPANFTPTSPFISPRSEGNLRERNEMRQETANKKDAAQTPDEAGATPPIDARCVFGRRGVAPASWRMTLAPMVWAASRKSSL